jgi:hypothetical protein
MECLASQDVTACPAEEPAAPAARPRQLAVGFRFDNLRGQDKKTDKAEKARRLPLRVQVAVPVYSRIVYRAGTVSVR